MKNSFDFVKKNLEYEVMY